MPLPPACEGLQNIHSRRSARGYAARGASRMVGGSDTRRVDAFPLYFGGDRPDHFKAGICHPVDEKHRELGVATRNRLDDLRGRGLRLGLAYHRLCDTKTLVYT